ncbi:hypothetical protein ACYOEI_24790 [Singulisphaera rosea]
MMAIVVLFALASLVARSERQRRVANGFDSPVRKSRIKMTVGGDPLKVPLRPDSPVPVSIQYQFHLDATGYRQGATARLYAIIWFEDMETNRYVDGYSFDSALAVGEREDASGRFVWNARVPHPGPFMLRYFLYEALPSGELRFLGGSGERHVFEEVVEPLVPGAQE